MERYVLDTLKEFKKDEVDFFILPLPKIYLCDAHC